MTEFWLDTSLPLTCEWCYSDLDPATGDCENGCDDWDRYWRSLTPAQQAAELALMDAHCAEQTGE